MVLQRHLAVRAGPPVGARAAVPLLTADSADAYPDARLLKYRERACEGGLASSIREGLRRRSAAGQGVPLPSRLLAAPAGVVGGGRTRWRECSTGSGCCARANR